MEELTKTEISRLLTILIKFNNWISKEREKDDLANKIQFPKIPSKLSESLAINLLRDKKILLHEKMDNFQFGRKTADILGHIIEQEINIEIKATAADFQYFGPKDIAADYLIWINLRNVVKSKNSCIEVFTVQSPNEYFKTPKKITLGAFKKKITEDKYIKTVIDINQYLAN